MRRLRALTVGFCAVSTPALADDLLRLEYSPFSVEHGGEFKITPLSGNAGATGLVADLSLDSLQSFCMQEDEAISPGSVYKFVINTGVPLQGGGFDPLDNRTAFLFTAFRNGTLSGYDYGAGRWPGAGDLQKAIWFIEGEAGGVNNAYVALANTAVGPGGAWEGKGLGSVRVLNLFTLDGWGAQDQLTIVPTPGAMVVAGLGLLGAARRRR